MDYRDNQSVQEFLAHHGIKGMHWGVRRYQNSDGSLTDAGKRRYSDKEIRQAKTKMAQKASKNPKSEEAKELMRQNREIDDEIDYLVNNFEFDGDDGGGGKTEADDKAGARYMELWDKKADIEDRLEQITREQVQKELIDKFGKERISEFETNERIKTGLKVSAFMLAIPVSIIALSARK